METFCWYDLETFGRARDRDRIAQFACLRTDADLRVLGEPTVLYCRPADDYLPDPGACLVTGISPQECMRRGVPEAEFARAILRVFGQAGTCVLGYNSIRFDDEFLRFLFYRNFHDPYAREYQHGNSRWDLLDVMRAACLLRPDGIHWPQREDGCTSFRLEELTRANGIGHADAHDALADVRATIAVAGLLRRAQPRLYEYLLTQRGKAAVRDQLDIRGGAPVLHVSGMIGAERGNASLFMPLARHPDNANSVICFDLREDPAPLLELDADEIRRRAFSPAAALGTEARIPLKEIHCNRCAVVMPARFVDDAIAARMQLDPGACERHARTLRGAGGLEAKLRAVYRRDPAAPADAEYALYQGFLPDEDRRLCMRLQECPPAEWLERTWPFQDPRLRELLPRALGRSYPQYLRGEAFDAWRDLCQRRLHEPGCGARTFDEFTAELARQRAEPPGQGAEVLDQVEAWATEVVQRAG